MDENTISRVEEICTNQITHFRRLVALMERGVRTTSEVKAGKKINTTIDSIAYYSQLIADLERTLLMIGRRQT